MKSLWTTWGGAVDEGGSRRGKKPLMSSSWSSEGVWTLEKAEIFGRSFLKANFLAVQISLGLVFARKRFQDFL
jgi:hypothetical protein